ncbi:sigma-70 family RNA polymerase sigma factor [Motilibacter sp. E257]|uniref:Sigma-70 family RNA polymerase sigma factor n=1 Tax=Motilibacter deserti TaxID=2714956 RepID=A0ABX0GSG7_9ACTN|nr:sigma-70 family RNA polymerase sigma factor [Motilibacter deserti]NHC13826.1 sigma-70 family RNA polymerase sigma factor [Motilibacter deserti]
MRSAERQGGSDVAARTVAELVRAAADGDQAAWDEIVERFTGLVWGVARSHRLSPADASDVSQTVWLRLVEHLGRLREPEALAGWIATTTRHECLRTLRASGRELPDEDLTGGTGPERPDTGPGPEATVVGAERRALVWEALGRLSLRCRTLLRALATSPDASYTEIAAALDMPIGSIGPTRGRCLQHLRRELAPTGALLED